MVVRFFTGDDDAAFPEAFLEGSDDELGMGDEEEWDTEPAFAPLEVSEGKLQCCVVHKFLQQERIRREHDEVECMYTL